MRASVHGAQRNAAPVGVLVSPLLQLPRPPQGPPFGGSGRQAAGAAGSPPWSLRQRLQKWRQGHGITPHLRRLGRRSFVQTDMSKVDRGPVRCSHPNHSQSTCTPIPRLAVGHDQDGQRPPSASSGKCECDLGLGPRTQAHVCVMQPGRACSCDRRSSCCEQFRSDRWQSIGRPWLDNAAASPPACSHAHERQNLTCQPRNHQAADMIQQCEPSVQPFNHKPASTFVSAAVDQLR